MMNILGGAVVVGGGGTTMFLLRPPTNFLVDKNSVKYGSIYKHHTPGGYEDTKNRCLWKGPHSAPPPSAHFGFFWWKKKHRVFSSWLLLLSRGHNNQPSPSAAMMGGGWRWERHHSNDRTSLSQPHLPSNRRKLAHRLAHHECTAQPTIKLI
jgi:hypothetical protein